MQEISSRILVDGKVVDFMNASYKNSGGVTAAQLTVTIPGEDVSYRKYWGKEMIAYLNEEDTYPFFRGYIMDTTIENDYGMRLVGLDALGWLTGHQKAIVFVDDLSNIDGYTVGGALKKLISLANLDNYVGTDYIGDTSPVITIRNNIRGEIVILDWLKKVLPQALDNTNIDLPRENTLAVRDDGVKGQLNIELVSDLDVSPPVYSFNINNIIDYKVKARKIPTTIAVRGRGVTGKYRNESAALAYGENFKTLSNNNLESPADCIEFARKAFYANVKNQYEITLSSYDGAYVMPNDIISINVDETDISNNYRVVGKDVTFDNNKYSVTLNINRRPPLLSDFLI